MADSPTSPQARLLATKPAAQYLGVSERTLWTLANSGALPSVRFGFGTRKSVRYDLDDLDRWIEAHKKGGRR